MKRFSPCLAFVIMSAIGAAPSSAAMITVFLAENGSVAFSDGTPLAGSGWVPAQGTIVLCDGATNTNNPSTATACASGVVDSDIVNFGGASTNVVMMSDHSPGDTNVADLLAFSVQFPGNTVFLPEAIPNASGIERTDFTPTKTQTKTQPGYAADQNGNTLQYEIVSDEAPEPSSLVLIGTGLSALYIMIMWPRKA